MAKNPTKKIYISYAHAGEGKQVTESLDAAFQARGVHIQRDVHDVFYKESFKKFMTELGAGDYVIAVIDKPYLESKNCMGELVAVYENEEFRKRIFPIVLKDAGIYDTLERLKYIAYWENKTKELEEAMRSVRLDNLHGIREELDLYTKIRQTFATMVDILGDMHVFKLKSHQEENFKTVFEEIHGKINKTDNTTPPPDPAPSIPPEVIDTLKKNVQTDISKNRVKEAIVQLTTFADTHQPDLISATTAIQREHDEIKRQKMRGTLTYSEVSRETNKLIDRMFEVLNSL